MANGNSLGRLLDGERIIHYGAYSTIKPRELVNLADCGALIGRYGVSRKNVQRADIATLATTKVPIGENPSTSGLEEIRQPGRFLDVRRIYSAQHYLEHPISSRSILQFTT